eukprot:SAG22_NODE_63_length_23302_cov_17.506551_3_plen_423_part_00
MNRLSQINSAMSSQSMNFVASPEQPANGADVVICAALRTPICKMGRGGLKDTRADKLMSTVMKAVIAETGISPEMVGDVCVGSTTTDLTQARVAQFEAGIPDVVPVKTTNRACSSGLQATMDVAGAIRNGQTDIGMSVGCESLSTQRKMGRQDHIWTPGIFETSEFSAVNNDSLLPMGITSENVAEKYGITRERQDRMAMLSNNNADAAWKEGKFDREVVPVETFLVDPQTGESKDVTISQDDSYRPGTTMEKLAKLKPAFKKGGSTTAGNASQLSDGAGAVILASRKAAEEHSLPVLGRIVSYAVVGCPPAIMGIGPAVAIPVALEKAGLTVPDIDIFEINEAFGSQASYSADVLGVPEEKLNPKGGGIALGHPFGMTGNRQIATLLHELRRTGKKLGVVSMCIGSGQGAAAVFEANLDDL